MVRRRGASRGRPVFRWFAESLALSGCVRRREAATRVSRDKGTNLKGVNTQRIRNPPCRATWRLTMKLVKSLILGSSAVIVGMSGAQAADLPVKAKAVEYVKVCSLYGAGFYYIPGTDTCIKIGGYLRVDTTFNGGVYGQPAWNGDLGLGDRYRDSYVSRSRAALTVDTRTATEYGVVRTFSQADFQFSTLGGSSYSPNGINSNLGNNGQLLDTVGGGYTAVEYVF